MKSKRWLLVSILVLVVIVFSVIILVACNADKGASQKPEPEAAPTSVSLAEDADVPAVDEPINEPAGEPEAEVAVDLLDAEAMLDTLGNFLLRPADLPEGYSIPGDGEKRMATIRLIQEMGEIQAKTYVKETGRIEGWWLELQRKNKADFVPNTIESSIELFETVEGARAASSPDHYSLYKDETRQYSPVAGGCDLGDDCVFFYSEREDPATETIIVQYNLAFTYRNAFVWLMARGFAFDTDADYVLAAAGKILEKLESAPTK